VERIPQKGVGGRGVDCNGLGFQTPGLQLECRTRLCHLSGEGEDDYTGEMEQVSEYGQYSAEIFIHNTGASGFFAYRINTFRKCYTFFV
jgi:hypothetical protein